MHITIPWRTSLMLAALGLMSGCSEIDPEGLAVLGYELVNPDSVEQRVLATEADGLDVPRDLAFDPEIPGNLWIVNRADDSTTILFGAGEADQDSQHIIDPFALHFMEEVSSIAFGTPGFFATCQESRNTYNDRSAPNDFMGPSLWVSDLDIYGQTNPDAVEFLGFDLGSHMDMQHETPLCTGIAWQSDNVYWTFDGLHQTIDRVDFGADHGPGYDDHSDGITETFDAGGATYLEGVPNHMLYDDETEMLTFADPANGRILQLDTASGTPGDDLPVTERGTRHFNRDGAIVTTLIDGLREPTGLARVDDVLFITLRGNGWILAVDVFTGEIIDQLDTGRGPDALMGIEAASMEELWVVDASANEVFRIRPPTDSE